MMRNRKGNYPDVVTFMEFALIFVIVAAATLFIVNNFDDRVQDMSEEKVPQEIKDSHNEFKNYVPSAIDYVFIFAFVAFFGFSITAARFIKSSPKFIITSVMALILLPLVSLMIENIWHGWYTHDTVNAALSSCTFLPFFMNHLVFFMLFYSVSIAIALLTKSESAEPT